MTTKDIDINKKLDKNMITINNRIVEITEKEYLLYYKFGHDNYVKMIWGNIEKVNKKIEEVNTVYVEHGFKSVVDTLKMIELPEEDEIKREFLEAESLIKVLRKYGYEKELEDNS